MWDLKNTTTEKSANHAIRQGLKQIAANPGGIILDYEEHEFSDELLMEVIQKRMQWHKNSVTDIMIVSRGKAVRILRYGHNK